MSEMLSAGGRVLLGRYELKGELGRGGMAVVYLAHDRRHHRQVALKVFAPAFGGPDGAERFHREIGAMARLRHPHILPLHDSGEVDGCLFYVMPFVDGESLRTRLTRLPLSAGEALRVTRQVADALAHAHRHGVVHRDIKPENILLAEGHAMLTDFGIAHVLAASGTRITEAGTAVGTPLYMSPEQTVSDPALDGRSDVFSLGCVLFEMLTGHPPFRAESSRGALLARFTGVTPSPGSCGVELPSELEELFPRLLAMDPAQRPTANDFVGTLMQLEAGVISGNAAYRRGPPGTLGKGAIDFCVPQPLGSLIGREHERQELSELLRRPDVRLVSLTGPGGAGKTRLALQLAHDLREAFRESVAFVDLAATTSASAFGSTLAAVLGVREHEERSELEAVRRRIGQDHVLLVLDNFEQLIDAAPRVAELLASCPALVVLVTSRIRLRLQGEHEFPVPPLELPDLDAGDPDELRNASAISLFLTRAAEVRPGLVFSVQELHTIAEICARLDALPLAIELAAARITLLDPAAMLSRLDRRLSFLRGGRRDAPERHRTLQSAIAWSHDLLNERERLFFRRLGVFAGGCPLAALAAVCLDDPGADDEALELTESLLEKNLLRRSDDTDEPRVAMLETIREFALAQLDAYEEAFATRERHARWFAGFAEYVAVELGGREQARRLAAFDRESANLQQALAWSGRSNQAERAARLARSLWRSWLIRGRLTDGRHSLERVLSLGGVSERLRAELLNALGTLAQNQGDYAAAYASFDESLMLWRMLDDKAGLAEALTSLGWFAFRRGRYADALAQSREGLELHRELGQLHGAARALTNLVIATIFTGDYDQARTLGAESLELRRRLGDLRDIGFGLTSLGLAIGRQGDRAAAERLLEEAIALYREVGERQLLAWTIAIVVEISDSDASAGAAELLEEQTLPTFREIGDRWGLAYALNVLGSARLHEGKLAAAAHAHLESLRLWEALEDGYGRATSHAHLALVAAAAGRIHQAAAFGTASQRQLTAMGGALAPTFARRLETVVQQARGVLGEQRHGSTVDVDAAALRKTATELLANLGTESGRPGLSVRSSDVDDT